MHHSIDSNDRCYSLDIMDDYVSDYVQNTWIKDELLENHEHEDPLDKLWCDTRKCTGSSSNASRASTRGLYSQGPRSYPYFLIECCQAYRFE